MQVDQIGRHLPVDQPQARQELLVAVPLPALPDDPPGGDVQGGEQRRRAMADNFRTSGACRSLPLTMAASHLMSGNRVGCPRTAPSGRPAARRRRDRGGAQVARPTASDLILNVL